MAFGRGMNNKQVVEQHMSEQLREYNEALSASQSKIKTLKSCLNTIAEKVCDGEYGDNQLGGKNKIMALSDYELRDFIINNYNKQRNNFTNSMIKMQQLCAQERADKTKYANSMLKLEEENQSLKAQVNNLEYELQIAKSQLSSMQASLASQQSFQPSYSDTSYDDDFDEEPDISYKQNNSKKNNNQSDNQNNNYSSNINKSQNNKNKGSSGQPVGTQQNQSNRQNQQQNKQNNQGNRQTQQIQQNKPQKQQSNSQALAQKVAQKAMAKNSKSQQNTQNNNQGGNVVFQDGQPFDIEKVLQRTDMLQREIIRIMGETGLNETKEIQAECLTQGKFTNTNKFREVLKLCKDNNLITETKNPVALRNQLVLNSLSDLGKVVYKRLFKKQPVVDEMTNIIRMHDNLIHGYNIKDTVTTLEGLGYLNVCMDAQKNAVKLPGGSTYIPDVVAEVVNANDKKRMKTYWEIELGNHHNNDFFDKLEKAAKVTKEVTIIVDKVDTKEHVAKQINDFGMNIKKQNKQITLVVYLGTLKELKDTQLFNNETNKFKIGSKNKK